MILINSLKNQKVKDLEKLKKKVVSKKKNHFGIFWKM